MTDDLLEGGNWWKTSDSPGSRSCFDPIGKFSYFEWRYVRYPWWLPPRDRCAWSLEIVRRHARVMEIDNQIFAAVEVARARQLAEARYSEQRRQALAAILYGVVIMVLVIAAAGG